MPGVVYVVMNRCGALESVWTDPEEALVAKDKVEAKGARGFITVRPLNSTGPTPESRAALIDLRKREADRSRA